MLISADPGTEGWIPFAKRQAERLAAQARDLKLEDMRKSWAPDAGTLIFVRGRANGDHFIRITGGMLDFLVLEYVSDREQKFWGLKLNPDTGLYSSRLVLKAPGGVFSYPGSAGMLVYNDMDRQAAVKVQLDTDFNFRMRRPNGVYAPKRRNTQVASADVPYVARDVLFYVGAGGRRLHDYKTPAEDSFRALYDLSATSARAAAAFPPGVAGTGWAVLSSEPALHELAGGIVISDVRRYFSASGGFVSVSATNAPLRGAYRDKYRVSATALDSSSSDDPRSLVVLDSSERLESPGWGGFGGGGFVGGSTRYDPGFGDRDNLTFSYTPAPPPDGTNTYLNTGGVPQVMNGIAITHWYALGVYGTPTSPPSVLRVTVGGTTKEVFNDTRTNGDSYPVTCSWRRVRIEDDEYWFLNLTSCKLAVSVADPGPPILYDNTNFGVITYRRVVFKNAEVISDVSDVRLFSPAAPSGYAYTPNLPVDVLVPYDGARIANPDGSTTDWFAGICVTQTTQVWPAIPDPGRPVRLTRPAQFTADGTIVRKYPVGLDPLYPGYTYNSFFFPMDQQDTSLPPADMVYIGKHLGKKFLVFASDFPSNKAGHRPVFVSAVPMGSDAAPVVVAPELYSETYRGRPPIA